MSWSTWNPFKPFGRDAAEVLTILEAVVAGRLDCREWDAFLRIPMPGTPKLDEIRLACAALDSEERIGDDGLVAHTPSSRKAIEDLIIQIRNEK
jgi:hypothetical protein